MYNEEFKKQFIADDANNKNFEKFMPTFFESIAKYEEEYNKDLCNFNIEEIRNYFTSLSTSSINRCMNIRSQFIKYSAYCEERNMVNDHQIHWEEADRQFVLNCINFGKVKSELVLRETLLRTINKFENARDKFLPLAIFEGVCGNMYSDFRELTMDDFLPNGEKYDLILPNRTIDVTKQLYYYAEESSESYVLYSERFQKGRAIFDTNDRRIIKRNKLASDTVADPGMSFLHKISNMLSKIKVNTGEAFFSQSALVNSGRLYYIYTHKEPGQKPYDYISLYRDMLTDRFGRIQSISGVVEQYEMLYGGEDYE